MDTPTPSTAVTVNQILDKYLSDVLPYELAPRTQVDYKRHIAKLKAVFGECIAEQMKPRDFGPFMDVRKGKVQRLRQLAVLSAAFTIAVKKWFWLERNVLRDVDRPRSKPRDRLVTAEEFSAFHAMANMRIRLAMELAVMTGQRQGDLLRLKWSDIRDMDVHIFQSKTGKRLAIEISKDLEAVLDRCWQLPNRGTHVLTPRHGGHYTSYGFGACWQRAMRKHMKRGGARFTFHDLRALAATRCATPEIAMRLLGHTNISMTMRVYRRGVERVKSLSLEAP